MGWVRIDDAFYDHPAHAALELDAWGLWVWSLAWSNRNLSDGKIPAAVVERMDPDGKASGALFDAGRWEHGDGVVIVHDYLEWQPSAEQVRSKRQKEQERWRRRAGSTATPRGVDAEDDAAPPASQPQPHSDPTDHASRDDEFERWWTGWPVKKDKSSARRAYAARIRAGQDPETLTIARDNYLAECEREHRIVKYASTFLHGNDGPWSEYLDPPEPPTIDFDAPKPPTKVRCERCEANDGFYEVVIGETPSGRTTTGMRVCDHALATSHSPSHGL